MYWLERQVAPGFKSCHCHARGKESPQNSGQAVDFFGQEGQHLVSIHRLLAKIHHVFPSQHEGQLESTVLLIVLYRGEQKLFGTWC